MKTFNNMEEYFEEVSGCKVSDLLDEQYQSYQIKNMDKAAMMIWNAAMSGKHIHIVGDYDADGVCALAIMNFIISSFTSNYMLRVPKRISEGYGLNEGIVDEVPAGSLLITVDNGIAAVDAIKKAKEKGCEVLILDHHVPGDVLPEADLIIDPEVSECEIKTKYCGAGLCFKLAEAFTWQDERKLDFFASFAAIATIADVVPLRYENRRICKKGIDAINSGICSAGILALMKACEIAHIDSSNIAFKIAPCLNSPGRLYDDGSKMSVLLLCETNSEKAEKMSADICSVNKNRKQLVANAMSLIEANMTASTMNNEVIANVVVASAPEGILGIIAGQLTEMTGKPSVVFTVTLDGTFKGSARCKKGNHLKEILDEISKEDGTILYKYGGHELAAGLSIYPDKFDTFKEMFLKKVKTGIPDQEKSCILCEVSDIADYADVLESMEPFGQCVPRPLFYLNATAQPMVGTGETYKLLGENNEHVKLSLGNRVSALGFNLAAQYKEIGFSPDIRITGDISFNYYKGNKYPQIVIDEFN